MRRPLLIGLALLVLALGAGRAALPGWLQEQAVLAARDQGLDLELEDLSLALLAGRLEVTGLSLATSDAPDPAAGPWLEVGRAEADLDWLPLVSRTVQLASFELERGELQLIHQDGSIALPWSPPGAAPEEETEVDDGEPWRFALERLLLDGVTTTVTGAEPDHDGSLSLGRVVVEALAFADNRLSVNVIQISDPELAGHLAAFAPEAPARPEAEEATASDPAGAEEAPDAGAMEATPLVVALDHLALTDSKVQIRLDAEREIEGVLTVRVDELSTETEARFKVEAEARIAGGSISVGGDVQLAPLAFELDVDASELVLGTLAGWGAPAAKPWFQSGTVGAAANLSSAADGAVVVSGSVALASLDFRAPQGKSLSVALPALEVTLKEVRTGAGQRAELGPVVLRDPELRVLSPDPALDELLAAIGGEESEEADPGEPFPVEIESTGIEGGSLALHIAGEPGDAPFDLAFEKISAKSGTAGLPLRIDGLELTTLVGGTTPFQLSGGIGGERGELEAAIEGLALAQFNPLVGRAGYEIEAGEAALEAAIRLRGPATDIANAVTLSDLALESDGAFEELFGLPVSAAIALMEDMNGAIHLDVPLSIDASGDSGIDLGPILLTAVRQAILGALTSPLKLVGATLDIATGGERGTSGFGGQGIEMLSGQATLSSDGEDQLAALARLLSERPRLSATLSGRTGAGETTAAPDLTAQRGCRGPGSAPRGVSRGRRPGPRRAVGATARRNRGRAAAGRVATADHDRRSRGARSRCERRCRAGRTPASADHRSGTGALREGRIRRYPGARGYPARLRRRRRARTSV